MIRTGHYQSVKGDVAVKASNSRCMFSTDLVVEMLCVDVVRRQSELGFDERAVGFVSFDDHQGPAQPCVGSQSLIIPPVITVGSRPAFSNMCATRDVVVVLPCVPVTDTVR